MVASNKLEELSKLAEPAVFKRSFYFSPFPSQELASLLERSPTELSKDLPPLQQRKRKQMKQLFVGAGSYFMALVNIDAVGRLERAYQTLTEKLPVSHPVLNQAQTLRASLIGHLDHLAACPIHEESCKGISHVCTQWDELICNNQDIQSERHLNANGEICYGYINEEEYIELYAEYGASYNGRSFENFEELLHQLGQGGFDLTWSAWSRESQPKIDMLDHVRLNLRTRSGVALSIYSRPESDAETQKVYSSSRRDIPNPLLPMYLYIGTTYDDKTVHADRLEKSFNLLLGGMDHTQIDEKSTLLYCPPHSQKLLKFSQYALGRRPFHKSKQ